MTFLERMDDLFNRAPHWAKILFCPILGFMFLMFLPIAGFVVTGSALIDWVTKKFKSRETADVEATLPFK